MIMIQPTPDPLLKDLQYLQYLQLVHYSIYTIYTRCICRCEEGAGVKREAHAKPLIPP